jgi:hypothetical protein
VGRWVRRFRRLCFEKGRDPAAWQRALGSAGQFAALDFE